MEIRDFLHFILIFKLYLSFRYIPQILLQHCNTNMLQWKLKLHRNAYRHSYFLKKSIATAVIVGKFQICFQVGFKFRTYLIFSIIEIKY